jgi:uncharacterized protein YndB with AHSA1/START domain
MPDTEESVSQIRTIKAPAHKVFAAWTDGAELQRWLAPIAQADGRVGGRFRGGANGRRLARGGRRIP